MDLQALPVNDEPAPSYNEAVELHYVRSVGAFMHPKDDDSGSVSELSDPEYVRHVEPFIHHIHHHDPTSKHELDKDEGLKNPKPIRKRCRELFSNWRFFIVVLTPILLLPIILALPDSSVAKGAYSLLLLAIYWCTEALPLAATALMPLVLAPMLGIMSTKAIATNYLTDLNFLFIGGLMFAVAIEKWNVHKRIALGVLIVMGTKPKMLLLGFIIVTGFLSMWLSNTATTALMIPIAHATLTEMWNQKQAHKKLMDEESLLKANGDSENRSSSDQTNASTTQPEEKELKIKDMSMPFQNLGKALSLSVCYASSIGGTGTLTGTGPNLIILGTMTSYFPESNDITFSSWLLYSSPLTIICLVICWLVLILFFLGPRSLFMWKDHPEFDHVGGRKLLRTEYKKLGPIKFPEIVLCVFFFILVMLWLWRDPKFIKGWDVIFKRGYISDGLVGVFVCLFLFAFPSSIPCMKSHTTGWKLGHPLLDWDTVQKKMAWGVILLLGGGFAVADICKASGFSDWLGCQLGALDSIPPVALGFVCTTAMLVLTEFTSNTSAASIFLPILAQLCIRLNIHPLYLLVPVTIASSFAFCFPVATPPNAIVFAYGHLRIIDMFKAGLVLNILASLANQLAVNTWGYAYFQMYKFPDWANKTNIAVSC